MGCDADGFATTDALYAHPREALSHEVRAGVRARILHVAASLLAPIDLRILEMHLDGDNNTVIAASIGRLRPNVSRSLHGTIMPRIKAALAKDPALASVAAETLPDEPRRGWYASILSPPHPERFVALAVLRELDELADAKRSVTYSTLYSELGRVVIDHAVPTLRTLGFITSDGHTVRVLKTPYDEVSK